MTPQRPPLCPGPRGLHLAPGFAYTTSSNTIPRPPREPGRQAPVTQASLCRENAVKTSRGLNGIEESIMESHKERTTTLTPHNYSLLTHPTARKTQHPLHSFNSPTRLLSKTNKARDDRRFAERFNHYHLPDGVLIIATARLPPCSFAASCRYS